MDLAALLPGLWVACLAAALALALRRWFDPVPGRCWIVWGTALAVMFGAVLFAGRVMLPLGYLTQLPPLSGLVAGPPPGNLMQSDLVLQIAPWLTRVRAAYAAGEWPLWNAFAGAGEPLLANPQSQAFQPLAWLALPFPVARGFGILAALRTLVALVFSFLLFRRQGISQTPALAGSLAYGFGGFLQLWLGWPLASSAAFLPLLLYAILRVDQRGGRRDGLLLAAATAAVLLVGHPETILHVLLLAACFALSRWLARPPGRRLALARAWTAAVLLGCGFAAPVVLPAAEYLPQSLRVTILSARHARLESGPEAEAPPKSARHRGVAARLAPLAAPNSFGNNRFGGYWGNSNIVEDASGFAGTAALLAALAALWPVRAGRRYPQERLMLGTALVCLAVLARPPGMERLLETLPVLRHSLSFHSRIALLLDLAIAYAAACSWERWRRGELPRIRVGLIAAALGALILWAYLAHPGPDPAAFARLRYGSLALQLSALGAAVLLPNRRAWGLATIVAAELLILHAPAHPPVRADLYYPVTPPIAFLQKRLDPWHRAAGLGPVLRPNLAAVYGFADPRSSNPAKPAAYAEATRPINRYPERATDGFYAPENPLFARLAVRFVMTVPGEILPAPYEPVWRRSRAWIYRNRRAPPLLFLASGPPLDLGSVRPAWLRARARLGAPQLLASSVYQDGNWQLLIDGTPRPTATADGPFVAAWLPAGNSRIDLLYRPASFVAGLALAALALAAGAALWVPPVSGSSAVVSKARNGASSSTGL